MKSYYYWQDLNSRLECKNQTPFLEALTLGSVSMALSLCHLGRKRQTAVFGAALALLIGAGSAQAASCDRNCLATIMQNYLSHLTAHNPAGLPISDKATSVENAKPTPLGSGAWQSVSRIRSSQIYTDPITGEAIFDGAVDTKDGLGVLFVRLKQVAGKITESEITFSHQTTPFSNPANMLEPDILYDAVVPPERRIGRAQLIAVVDNYLNGISIHDGSHVAFGPRCDRYASGAKVTNSAAHPADKEGGTCAGSLVHLTGELVVNRRIAVVDQELGLVGVMFIIPHDDHTPPASTHVSELFKIVDGKIRSIEEFSFSGGWPPDSGFQSDIETGTPDTKRVQNMHPSPEFLHQVLSGPPPIVTFDRPLAATTGQLQVHSATIEDNHGYFPIKNTGWANSISPAVSWSAGPAGTKSYLVIMEDGTAGMKTRAVLHWVVFNIPTDTTSLPEGISQLPGGMKMGGNQGGDAAYTGPHSPAGGPIFHYHIQVYALDKLLDLPSGATRDQVWAAMTSHVLAKGQFIANFQGPRI